MSTKIRKQIYVEKRQDKLVKRLAEARGVSEAEIIRQALDHEADEVRQNAIPTNPVALDHFLTIANARARAHLSAIGKPYKWNRESAYEDDRP